MNFRSLNNFLEFDSENEIWKRGKQLIALGELLAQGLILLAWSKGQHGPQLAHASGAARRGRADGAITTPCLRAVARMSLVERLMRREEAAGARASDTQATQSPDMVSVLDPHRGDGAAWRR
jgi:hypothetical protein